MPIDRERLADALTRIEVRVPATGPMAGKIVAEQMADAIIQAYGEQDPARQLLEEALHLRMNGEYAPGGCENWRQWDRKAEAFLRGLARDVREDGDHGD
jgi:hypothetical protein